MKKTQHIDQARADAIAQAILQPDLEAQEGIRRKRAAEARSLAERRLVALCSMPGFAIGAAVAHLTGHRFSSGVIWGGLAGAIVGWAAVAWRRRHAMRR